MNNENQISQLLDNGMFFTFVKSKTNDRFYYTSFMEGINHIHEFKQSLN